MNNEEAKPKATLNIKAWHLSLFILLAGAVLSAFAVRILFVDPVKNGPHVSLAVASQQLPTATAEASTSQSAAPATATARPPQQVVSPTDRSDCNTIRGTEYRSDSERAWYLANCVKT